MKMNACTQNEPGILCHLIIVEKAINGEIVRLPVIYDSRMGALGLEGPGKNNASLLPVCSADTGTIFRYVV